jgi:nucleoid-associated protein YgaU
MLRLFLLMLMIGLVSCSASKKSKDVGSDSQGIEVSDADEFLEGDSTEAAPAEDFGEDLFAEETPAEPVEPAEPLFAEEPAGVAEQPQEVMEPLAEEPMQGAVPVIEPVMAQGTSTYTVQEGETLMMISFKLYGDYLKWRSIAKLNSDVITDGQTVSAGMQIKYAAPSQEFVWSPSGNPYLIKWGDTLGKISNNVYGDMGKWKMIWKNNEPLINDPNKIYAGFTIYTPENTEQPQEDPLRDLANEGI